MTEKDKYQLLLDELIGPLKGFVNTLTKKNELLSNKVKSILENKDSDEKYPTVKAVYDFIRESINSISFDGFETTDNKVKKLDETSTDGQYPTAKAVYDELQKFNNVTILQKGDFINGAYASGGIINSDYWIITPESVHVKVGDVIKIKPSEGLKVWWRIYNSPDLSVATNLLNGGIYANEVEYISEFDGYFNVQVAKKDGTRITPDDYACYITVHSSRVKNLENEVKAVKENMPHILDTVAVGEEHTNQQVYGALAMDEALNIFGEVLEELSDNKPKVFERIATVTVTPDSDGSLPTKITINKDDDGNPFELTDVYCDVLIGLTDGLTGRFYVSVGNPSERNIINVMGNAALNINNTQLRKWCFRVDNYGDGRGGLTSAPSVSLMHTADFPSANISTMYGQPIPVWRTIDIREVQFVGQAGNTQTFMEGTTITLWGVRKQ